MSYIFFFGQLNAKDEGMCKVLRPLMFLPLCILLEIYIKMHSLLKTPN